MLAGKKSSSYIYNKFTLNLKIGALLLIMSKIRLLVKYGEMYILIVSHNLAVLRLGRVLGRGSTDCWFASSQCSLVFSLHCTSNHKILNVSFLWYALCYEFICVTAGA